MLAKRRLLECLRIPTSFGCCRGSVNIRRKTAFAATAYTDSEVLGLYFEDDDQPWNGIRHSVIQALDLGNKELRKEALQLGDKTPFAKTPTNRSGSYEELGVSLVVNTAQKEAPMLLQTLR